MLTRALAVALALVGVLAVFQAFQLSRERLAHAETREEHAQQIAAMATAARLAELEAREEETRRQRAIEEVTHEALQRETQARADAAAAGAAADRLRRQLAAITAAGRQAPSDPNPASAGPAAGDPIGVLADVLARADERAGILAAHADAARTAGLACQRAYETLIP